MAQTKESAPNAGIPWLVFLGWEDPLDKKIDYPLEYSWSFSSSVSKKSTCNTEYRDLENPPKNDKCYPTPVLSPEKWSHYPISAVARSLQSYPTLCNPHKQHNLPHSTIPVFFPQTRVPAKGFHCFFPIPQLNIDHRFSFTGLL